MKKILLLAAIVCIAMETHAQKTDSEKIKITYTQLPKKPLEMAVKKYDVKIINTAGIAIPKEEVILKHIKLDGFQFSKEKPDVFLVLNFDAVKFDSQIFPKVNLNSTTSYFYKGNATLEASIRFLTADNQFEYYRTTKFDKELSGDFESILFQTEAAAKEAMTKDKDLKDKATSNCIDQSLLYIGRYVDRNFGYSSITDNFPIYTILSKEFDYAEIEQSKINYMKAMAQYTTAGLTVDNQKLLEDAVAVWVKNVGEYKPADKKARISSKNILELYMNLAIANTWLNKFDEARKYLALAAEEKGLNGVKADVEQLISSREIGYQQNTLREKNELKIDKTESDFFAAPDFKVETHAYRIKYIEYYDEFNARKLHHRRVFEYDPAGQVNRFYTQQYDGVTKTYTGESDLHRVTYNSKDRIISIFKDQSTKPEFTQTVHGGKIISKAGKDKYTVFNLVFSYDKAGNPLGYVNSLQGSKKISTIRYDNGKVAEMIEKTVTAKDTIPASKLVFTWQENNISSIDFFYNPSDAKSFNQKAYSNTYSYDAGGKLIKVKGGYETYNYTYDANGNVIELIVNGDSNPEHKTYVWEAGSGNASLILRNASLPIDNPWVYPQVY